MRCGDQQGVGEQHDRRADDRVLRPRRERRGVAAGRGGELRVPEVDRDDPRRQAEGRGLDHLQPACRARPRGREQRGQERHGDHRGGLERPGRAPAEHQVAHQDQGQAGRQQEGHRAEPDEEQRVLLVGEPRVAVRDELHRAEPCD